MEIYHLLKDSDTQIKKKKKRRSNFFYYHPKCSFCGGEIEFFMDPPIGICMYCGGKYNIILSKNASPDPKFVVDGETLIQWFGKDKYVTLPDNIKRIKSDVFFNRENLKRIKLPDGLKTIDASAFEDCIALESVTVPDSLTKIDPSAFSGCVSLKTVIASETWKKAHPKLLKRILEPETEDME